MKKLMVLALLLSLPPASTLAAQLYRWVDEKGHVEWRDTPPPPTAKKVEQRNLGGNTIQTTGMPYSLQQAMKSFPVTLWITNCGDICNKARALLGRRGVPYTERNPEADVDGFKKAAGASMELPLLLVGDNKLRGYLESDWDAALDAAGYPRTALVPVKPVIAPAPAAPAPAPAVPAGTAPAPQRPAAGPAPTR